MEVNDEDEFDMVVAFIEKNGLRNTRIMIGMTDEGHEGNWTYLTSGAPVTFTKWDKGEPNNDGTGENYAILYKGYA